MTLRFFRLAVWLLVLAGAVQAIASAPKREFYQLKIYHVRDANQKSRLETYLQKAYLPALHRAGIKQVGVFVPNTGADSLLYVLTPFKSVDQFSALSETLMRDKQYTADAAEYINAPFDQPYYSRFESVLMQAFATMPTLVTPGLTGNRADRVYELRSYEAATEKLHEAKVAQFNNGELDIFKRLGFNTVFCGQVQAGGKMPNMYYMTSFTDKADRDAHWKAFGADPAWKTLNSLPEYAHNFMRADTYLLHPTAYSDY